MTFRWPGIIFDLASIRVLLDDVPGKGEVPIGWASHGFEDGREGGREEGRGGEIQGDGREVVWTCRFLLNC